MPTKKPDAKRRFADALLEIGPTMGKTAENPFFNSRYIPLPVLLEEVMPILNKHGLQLTYPNAMPTTPGTAVVAGAVSDQETGEIVAQSVVVMPLIDNPQKNTQNYTYGRRTVTTCLLGIAEKDDDGNSAAGNNDKKKSTPKAADKDIDALFS